MPRQSSRQARARDMLKTFINYHTARVKNLLHRKNKAKRAFARIGLTLEEGEQMLTPAFHALDTISVTMASETSVTSDMSISSDLDDSLGSDSSEDWSDILGSDWSSSSSSSASSDVDSTATEDENDSLPDLHPPGYPDSDDDDEDSDSDSTSDSGDDADDEDEWDLDGQDDLPERAHQSSPPMGVACSGRHVL
ncbi:hypothetical protein MSAN_01111300 [Mycena sanguinolenta]|uniref:Uncharacterized protein n=1 Tax=Mycena sanguinolenta TaxID=230812 RepID=A0A8H7D6M7_9AGAR|nr:hypothetical protein MSAN_01111300 [Mycena sanguinolenta]